MAMKTFSDGTVASAADANEYFVNTKFAIKPGDTFRNTTTTMTADPDLTLQVDASKTYQVDVVLMYHSNTVANFKFAFSAPGGSVLYGTNTGLFVGAGTAYGVQNYDAAAGGVAFGTAMSMQGQDPFESSSIVAAVLITAGAAGQFTVRWAQDTSGGFNAAIRAGSYMILRRVS